MSPHRWESIYHLGKYYKYIAKDYKKALKCYQKAYELSEDLNLCGLELVDCLLHEKEDVRIISYKIKILSIYLR